MRWCSDNPGDLFTRNPQMWQLRAAMFVILLGIGIGWCYAGIWMKQHEVGETVIGVLMGFGGALAALAGVFWGWLSDRTGRSTAIVIAGCILTGIALIVLSQSSAAPGFALYIVLIAFGLSAAMTMMPVLALSVIGDRKPGGGYGRFRIFGSMGYLFGLYGLAAVVDGIGKLLLVAGIVMLIAVVPLLIANVTPRRHTERRGLGGVFRCRPFVWFLVAYFFFQFGGPGVFTFLAMYAKELGMGDVSVARLMGMNGVVAMIGLPLLGTLSDRAGAKGVILLAFLSMPARLLLQAAAQGGEGLYVAQLFHTFTWAGMEATMYVYVTRLVGEQDRGVAVSVALTTRTVAELVANPLIGYLAENHGYRLMFCVISAIAGVGLLVFCCTGMKRETENVTEEADGSVGGESG